MCGEKAAFSLHVASESATVMMIPRARRTRHRAKLVAYLSHTLDVESIECSSLARGDTETPGRQPSSIGGNSGPLAVASFRFLPSGKVLVRDSERDCTIADILLVSFLARVEISVHSGVAEVWALPTIVVSSKVSD